MNIISNISTAISKTWTCH